MTHSRSQRQDGNPNIESPNLGASHIIAQGTRDYIKNHTRNRYSSCLQGPLYLYTMCFQTASSEWYMTGASQVLPAKEGEALKARWLLDFLEEALPDVRTWQGARQAKPGFTSSHVLDFFRRLQEEISRGKKRVIKKKRKSMNHCSKLFTYLTPLFNSPVGLWNESHYYAHFTAEEIDALRGARCLPQARRTKQRFKPSLSPLGSLLWMTVLCCLPAMLQANKKISSFQLKRDVHWTVF